MKNSAYIEYVTILYKFRRSKRWNGAYLFFNSILLGAGMAMDAFSVSLANGLNEPEMGRSLGQNFLKEQPYWVV